GPEERRSGVDGIAPAGFLVDQQATVVDLHERHVRDRDGHGAVIDVVGVDEHAGSVAGLAWDPWTSALVSSCGARRGGSLSTCTATASWTESSLRSSPPSNAGRGAPWRPSRWAGRPALGPPGTSA